MHGIRFLCIRKNLIQLKQKFNLPKSIEIRLGEAWETGKFNKQF